MKPKRRSGTLRGLAKVGTRRKPEGSSVGDILTSLGDRSFGWGFVLGGLINMLPLPPGSNMALGLPAVFVAVQMAWGRSTLWLPGFIRVRSIARAHWRGAALTVLPIARPLSRITHVRMTWMFEGRSERLLGLLFVLTALNLILPLPLSGWVPAIAIFVVGLGLVEHDGLIVLLGCVIGVFSLFLSAAVASALFLGYNYMIE